MPTPDLSLSLYIVLIVIGLLLIGAEVFLPGGVLGAVGGVCLVGAVILGFVIFNAQGGLLSMVLLIGASAVFMVIWLRLFPHTYIGRKLTLSRAIDGDAANPDQHGLVGQEGETITDLRPGGLARIDEKRIDVVAQSGWVDAGKRIKVIDVEGIRVVVREV